MVKRLVPTTLVVLLSATGVAHADSIAKRYAATVTQQPTFAYSDATIEKPVQVDAVSADGTCKVTAALVGMQQGNAQNNTMVGRITGGTCDGMPVDQGFVIASVTSKGKQVTLNQELEFVIFRSQ